MIRRHALVTLSASLSVIVALVVGLASAPPAAADIRPTKAQLTSWGFTVAPNVANWAGGTAVLAPSDGTARAGSRVVLRGMTATGIASGTRLRLQRFYPADATGRGSFRKIGSGISTVANSTGTYYVTFDVTVLGRYGYALVGRDAQGSRTVVKFQLRTTS